MRTEVLRTRAQDRRKTEFNACGIRSSSDVPTYRKMEKPIQMYENTYYFDCERIRKNVFSRWLGTGKRFQVDVSVEI